MSIKMKEDQNLIYNILTTKTKFNLPITIAKQIIFLALPDTITNNPYFKDELHLEKSFRMIDKTIYYTKSPLKCRREVLIAMTLLLHEKKNIWRNPDKLTYVYNNLKKCGCCERHSQGVIMGLHNTNIKTHKSFRTRLQNDYSFCEKECKCCCRHYMRMILRSYPEIEPYVEHIFNILEDMVIEDMSFEDIMTI